MVIITEEEEEEFINHTRGIFHLFCVVVSSVIISGNFVVDY